jgi:hypothetical protein
MKKIVLLALAVLFTLSLFADVDTETDLIERTMKINIPSFTLLSENEALESINNTLYSDSFKLLDEPESDSIGFKRWDIAVYISEATITYKNDKLASFKTTQYMYPYHAAHGSHLFLGYIFDSKSGKKLTTEDIFSGKDYKAKILKFMKKEIAEKDIQIFSDLEFKGIDKNTEFYLENDDLIVVFQEYEYTPYCYGFLIFKIPLEYLKDSLNKKYF